jgi:hypothetical protein
MPKRRINLTSKELRSGKKKKGSAVPGAVAPTANENPVKPATLAGRAAQIWDEHAPALILQGMLTTRDVLMFGLWCRLAERVENGELSGALVTQFRLIANDFGLSPSGKGRENGPIIPPVPGAKSKFFND